MIPALLIATSLITGDTHTVFSYKDMAVCKEDKSFIEIAEISKDYTYTCLPLKAREGSITFIKEPLNG